MIRLAVVTTFVFLFGCAAPESPALDTAPNPDPAGTQVDELPVPQPDQA